MWYEYETHIWVNCLKQRFLIPGGDFDFFNGKKMQEGREEPERGTGYSYAANSNLVLQAKRSDLPRRSHEPDGTAESLWGKLKGLPMGDRARPDAPAKSSRRSVPIPRESVSFVAAPAYGLVYSPQTSETRQVYEMILSLVQPLLGTILSYL